MMVKYNQLTTKVKILSWEELESGCLYMRVDEDGQDSPRIFMFMEYADEWFLFDIFGGPYGDVYYSGDVECGFYPVTIEGIQATVHRFGPPA
ncbi:hypothetical protein [Pseudomonas phage BUCT640]|nr:hypothetical protein [Pseudomonas phage BUCT640]